MFDKEVYISRREKLRSLIGGGVILLPGNCESPVNYPENGYRFRQDSTFLYFFGISYPDYIAVIDTETGIDELYGDDFTIDDIIWTGPQPSLQEKGWSVGVAHTYPKNSVSDRIKKAMAQGRKVHFLPPYRAQTELLLSELTGFKPETLKDHISVELALAVVALREIKELREIAEIEKACAIGFRMQLLAMRMCREGVVEREIAGAIEGVALQYGAGVSFPSIVTHNGQTLHNHYYGNRLAAGRMLLVDAGAETTMNYCSDYTRTIPVSGKFTSRQKDVYDIVLAANARAFELSSPDYAYCDIHRASARIIAAGLKDLGLMRGDIDEAVGAGAQALFMPHGLGHQLGLDVHDMENIGEKYVGYDRDTMRSSTPGLCSLRMGKRLKPGMVMTVEPGIYFIPELIAKWKREKICQEFIDFDKVGAYLDFGGIRIEDDILITETGNRMLGEQRPPVTTERIEEVTGKMGTACF